MKKPESNRPSEVSASPSGKRKDTPQGKQSKQQLKVPYVFHVNYGLWDILIKPHQ